MTTKKETKVEKPVAPEKPAKGFVFNKLNYQLLIIGLVIIFLGFILMAGGGSKDPNQFDTSMFSFRRITLAPVIVLVGFVLEGVAIMYRPKSKKNN